MIGRGRRLLALCAALVAAACSLDPTPTLPTSHRANVASGAGASSQRWTNVSYSFANGSSPITIAVGADKNFWIADSLNGIVRMTPSGQTTLYPMPQGYSDPFQIVRGHHSDLWFSGGSTWLGRITTSGAMTIFPVNHLGSSVGGIAKGPNGTIWFVDSGANGIGRVSADGTIVEFPVPTQNGSPFGIALGPDGDMWFTEFSAGKIGRITLKGVISEMPSAANPGMIAAGPGTDMTYSTAPFSGDAFIYILSADGSPIAQVDAGRLAEPDLLPTPSGDVWAPISFCCGSGTSVLDRITTGGFVTQYPPPFTPNGSELLGSAFGPDGTIWIADPLNGSIDIFHRR